MLVNLSENCIEAAKKLKNWGNRQEELSIGKETNAQMQNISNQMNKFNQTAWLTSKYNGWYIFGKFLKFAGMFLIAPALLLFWVFTDPYKEAFCANHFQHRPIKEERTRRFIIYAIASVVWLVLILVIFGKI